MILLDTLKVYCAGEERSIELYHGDLTRLRKEEAVDVLIISAFPDDYSPIPTSLIGALHRKGLSVERLARSKAVDLRANFSCWLSKEIPKISGLRFKRILCFESWSRGPAPEFIGDIFRALAPFLNGEIPMSTAAMPIIAVGDQGYDLSDVLPPLIDAAVHWMTLGFPLKRLKIVAYSDDQADEACALFATLRPKHAISPFKGQADSKYDVFISYAHEDFRAANLIAQELHELRPKIRVFMDRLSINVGAAWQPEIFEAIDLCRKIVALFSPSYLSSKVCKEEFNIAWMRGREYEEDLVFPVYLYSAALPTYMKYRLYVDCREGNEKKLRNACAHLISAL